MILLGLALASLQVDYLRCSIIPSSIAITQDKSEVCAGRAELIDGTTICFRAGLLREHVKLTDIVSFYGAISRKA